MLDAAARGGQKTYAAIAPQEIADFIHAHCEYRQSAVVMSGDTGFFSGTRKLLPLLSDCEVSVLPGLGMPAISMAWFAARLRALGFDARTLGYRSIVDGARYAIEEIGDALQAGPAPLVGHSLGAQLPGLLPCFKSTSAPWT